jgi:hypothetical protein
MINLAPADHPSESQHWYSKANGGEPCYEIMGKNGKPRPATLRDARVMGLIPGVTSILKMAAAPGLEVWKQRQVLESALTLPRDPEESEENWLAAVMRDSQEQGRKAAERGTAIHAAVEEFYKGGNYLAEFKGAVDAVRTAIDEQFGSDARWYAETVFADPIGYGGKSDLLSHPTTVDALIDVKSKEFTADVEPKTLAYEEHVMQLAAYRHGLQRPGAICANLFVTRQEPWIAKIHVWGEDELRRGLRMFLSLFSYYRAKNNFEPGWTPEVPDDGLPF